MQGRARCIVPLRLSFSACRYSPIGMRVLLVTYYYPPSGGSGVQRPLKMSRYLPEFGCEVTVLTVDPAQAAYPDPDPSMLADVPAAVQVVRTPSWDPYAAYARLTGKAKADAVGVGFARSEALGRKEQLARWLRANVFLPDARVGWVPFAIRAARRLHAAQPFDVVLTTAPPMSLHLIGLALAAQGLPWVADFRDPWTDVYYLKELPRSALARRLDLALERRVLRRATRLVSVSASVAAGLGGKVGRPVAVIPNGFDPADFADAAPALDPAGPFTLSFVGNFLGQQNPPALWEALARIVAEPGHPEVRLRLVGHVDPLVLESVAQRGPGRPGRAGGVCAARRGRGRDAPGEPAAAAHQPHGGRGRHRDGQALRVRRLRAARARRRSGGRRCGGASRRNRRRAPVRLGRCGGHGRAAARAPGRVARRVRRSWAQHPKERCRSTGGRRPGRWRRCWRLRRARWSRAPPPEPVRRVLYLYLSPSSFVLDDLAHLRARYEVVPFHFDAQQAKGAARDGTDVGASGRVAAP